MRPATRDAAPAPGTRFAPALALGTILMSLGAGPWAAGAQPPPPPPGDPEDEAKKIVVMVRGTLGGAETFGAGILVGSRANRLYVATANHVVRKGLDQAQDLRVELRSLPGEWIEAKLLKHEDDVLDLAVLNVPGLSEHHITLEGVRFDRLGDPEGLERGDPVFHVGNRSGNKWRANVSPDAVSEVRATEVRFETTFIAPGSSGGGLFDGRWRLVGLVRADQPPDGVATRIDRVVEQLERWGYPVDLAPDGGAGHGGTEPGRGAVGPGDAEEPRPCAGSPGPRVTLRTEPADLTLARLRDTIEARGFTAAVPSFTTGGVEEYRGSFVNSFELFGEFVADCATGLMWHRGTVGPYTLERALSHVENLNRARHGGYSDWRVPTVEELASLTQPRGVAVPHLNVPLFLDPGYFDGRGYYALSCDRLSAPEYKDFILGITWAGNGFVGMLLPDQTSPLKPVRTIE